MVAAVAAAAAAEAELRRKYEWVKDKKSSAMMRTTMTTNNSYSLQQQQDMHRFSPFYHPGNVFYFSSILLYLADVYHQTGKFGLTIECILTVKYHSCTTNLKLKLKSLESAYAIKLTEILLNNILVKIEIFQYSRLIHW